MSTAICFQALSPSTYGCRSIHSSSRESMQSGSDLCRPHWTHSTDTCMKLRRQQHSIQLCIFSHILCVVLIKTYAETELGCVLKLCVPFCFRPFFLKYLEFSICLQWKHRRILFQSTDWPLHWDVFQIIVVLSRVNPRSPQPEFPSRFKTQCRIWDGAWLSHLIPTNCMICSSASCQSNFSITYFTFCILSLKASFQVLF